MLNNWVNENLIVIVHAPFKFQEWALISQFHQGERIAYGYIFFGEFFEINDIFAT